MQGGQHHSLMISHHVDYLHPRRRGAGQQVRDHPGGLRPTVYVVAQMHYDGITAGPVPQVGAYAVMHTLQPVQVPMNVANGIDAPSWQQPSKAWIKTVSDHAPLYIKQAPRSVTLHSLHAAVTRSCPGLSTRTHQILLV